MARIVKRLTDKEIEAARPESKDYRLYDGEGLCLLIRKSGTKVWQYPYVYKDKKTIYTIGAYHKSKRGAIGLKKAREIRHEVRVMLDQGINPNAEKKERIYGVEGEEKTTFEALGREWHSKGVWVSKHAKNILRGLEGDVFPFIGHKQIKEVTRQDIIEVLTRIEAREAFDVAKRICQRCEAIFDYAISKAVCEGNPALGRAKFIKKPKTKPRPYLEEHQLPEFLNKLDDYHGRDYIRLAMKFLVLTLVRPGELCHALWSEINEKEAVWKIPAERMKMDRDHIVPLSTQALVILKDIKKITGGSELLFPGIKNDQKPISDVTLIKVLRIMGYVGDQKVVPHGMRHTASTILNENDFNGDHIEMQLAHVERNKVRGTYNHATYLDERARMMQWWADHLDNLREKYEAPERKLDGTGTGSKDTE